GSGAFHAEPQHDATNGRGGRIRSYKSGQSRSGRDPEPRGRPPVNYTRSCTGAKGLATVRSGCGGRKQRTSEACDLGLMLKAPVTSRAQAHPHPKGGISTLVRWRCCLPGPVELVFVIVLLITLIGGWHSLFNDPGTLWHLRLGRDIVASG